jgi:hypothetical protein
MIEREEREQLLAVLADPKPDHLIDRADGELSFWPRGWPVLITATGSASRR